MSASTPRMKGKVVRFGRRASALIRHEAAIEGVSSSQYIRESAYARVLIAMARRGESIEFLELADHLDELADRNPLHARNGKPLPSFSEDELAATDDAGGLRDKIVRFGSRQWALIQREAQLDGTSASQFVREAAYARAVISLARRGEGADILELARLLGAYADDPPKGRNGRPLPFFSEDDLRSVDGTRPEH